MYDASSLQSPSGPTEVSAVRGALPAQDAERRHPSDVQRRRSALRSTLRSGRLPGDAQLASAAAEGWIVPNHGIAKQLQDAIPGVMLDTRFMRITVTVPRAMGSSADLRSANAPANEGRDGWALQDLNPLPDVARGREALRTSTRRRQHPRRWRPQTAPSDPDRTFRGRIQPIRATPSSPH